MRRYKMTVTTAADGTVTATSVRVSGKLHSIQYVPDGSVPYTNTVDMTITAKDTGESILALSNVAAGFVKYPRAPVHDQAGAALLYAAGGTAQTDKIALHGDQVQIALVQGGNAKKGVFHILVD